MRKEILCPICSKMLCKIGPNGVMRQVYLYCKKCKEERLINIEIEPKSHN